MGTHTIEKMHDEGRAAMATQMLVELPYDEDGFQNVVGEMIDKYYTPFYMDQPVADLTIETKCWAATESIMERLHEADELHGPPTPPLYWEVCQDPKIFQAKQASPIEKVQLKPRFNKRTRQSLMDWLSAHELGVQDEDLFEEIQVADVKMSKPYLVNLCERVWNAL